MGRPICTLSLDFCCLTSGSEEVYYEINISLNRGADFASILAHSQTTEWDTFPYSSVHPHIKNPLGLADLPQVGSEGVKSGYTQCRLKNEWVYSIYLHKLCTTPLVQPKFCLSAAPRLLQQRHSQAAYLLLFVDPVLNPLNYTFRLQSPLPLLWSYVPKDYFLWLVAKIWMPWQIAKVFELT